jgi:hypothetical protein
MVSIRIGSRLAAITGKFGLDDVFILIGWTLATVCLVLTVLCTFAMDIRPFAFQLTLVHSDKSIWI